MEDIPLILEHTALNVGDPEEAASWCHVWLCFSVYRSRGSSHAVLVGNCRPDNRVPLTELRKFEGQRLNGKIPNQSHLAVRVNDEDQVREIAVALVRDANAKWTRESVKNIKGSVSNHENHRDPLPLQSGSGCYLDILVPGELLVRILWRSHASFM